jgi:hypothetical protein
MVTRFRPKSAPVPSYRDESLETQCGPIALQWSQSGATMMEGRTTSWQNGRGFTTTRQVEARREGAAGDEDDRP